MKCVIVCARLWVRVLSFCWLRVLYYYYFLSVSQTLSVWLLYFFERLLFELLLLLIRLHLCGFLLLTAIKDALSIVKLFQIWVFTHSPSLVFLPLVSFSRKSLSLLIQLLRVQLVGCSVFNRFSSNPCNDVCCVDQYVVWCTFPLLITNKFFKHNLM